MYPCTKISAKELLSIVVAVVQLSVEFLNSIDDALNSAKSWLKTIKPDDVVYELSCFYHNVVLPALCVFSYLYSLDGIILLAHTKFVCYYHIYNKNCIGHCSSFYNKQIQWEIIRKPSELHWSASGDSD